MVGLKLEPKKPIHISAEPTLLEITDKDGNKIFEIDNDGKVFWLKKGKFTQAKIDRDLALAFMIAICETLGIGYEKVIDKIRAGEKIMKDKNKQIEQKPNFIKVGIPNIDTNLFFKDPEIKLVRKSLKDLKKMKIYRIARRIKE